MGQHWHTTPRVLLVETPTHGRALVREATDGPAAGILLGFHGYAESADLQWQRLTSIPGAGAWTIVSVQGLNRFYRGRGEEIVAGWMTRQDRELAIADNIRYVDAVVEAVRDGAGRISRADAGADSRTRAGSLPIVCAGFSQGVAMAFRAAVRGRAGCAGVIAVGGDVPPELLAAPDSRFPAVLLARGGRDEWYTAARLEHDMAALRSRGVQVHTLTYDAGHEWSAAVDAKSGEFLRTIVEAAGIRQPKPNANTDQL